MKFLIRTGLLGIVAVTLTACAATGGATTESAGGASSGDSALGLDGLELTQEMSLMLGTMKLDEVGLAPDAAQASELRALWQVYRSLATSDTAANQELEAVLKQVRAAMTAEQLQAIADMDLDQEDLTAYLESFREAVAAGEIEVPQGGGPFGLPGEGAGGGPLVIGPGPGGGEGGAGGPRQVDGVFVGPPGGDASGLSPDVQATAQASGGFRLAGRGGLFLLEPLIAELEALAEG